MIKKVRGYRFSIRIAWGCRYCGNWNLEDYEQISGFMDTKCQRCHRTHRMCLRGDLAWPNSKFKIMWDQMLKWLKKYHPGTNPKSMLQPRPIKRKINVKRKEISSGQRKVSRLGKTKIRGRRSHKANRKRTA